MCSTLLSAPTFLHYEVKPVSDTYLQFSWSVDSSKSGNLDYYLLNCVDQHGIRVEPRALFGEPNSYPMFSLQPNTTYNCSLTARARPAPGQNPTDCYTTVTFPPVKTYLSCKYPLVFPSPSSYPSPPRVVIYYCKRNIILRRDGTVGFK